MPAGPSGPARVVELRSRGGSAPIGSDPVTQTVASSPKEVACILEYRTLASTTSRAAAAIGYRATSLSAR